MTSVVLQSKCETKDAVYCKSLWRIVVIESINLADGREELARFEVAALLWLGSHPV